MDPIAMLATELDPALLMDVLGLPPDPWQAAVLRAADDRLLMLCARQAGKSTVTAALGLHTALFQPGSLVLLLSPTQRQSGELFRKIVEFFHRLGGPVPAEQVTATTLFLANGSRVVSLPGSADTIRGFSAPKLVIIDEAALTDDDLFAAAAPMVAVSRGRLVCLSTPFGARGWFHEQWSDVHSQWRKIVATAEQCPRIAADFLAEQRRLLGPRWFNQEFLCTFEETSGQVFSTESILAAFTSERPPLFGSTLG